MEAVAGLAPSRRPEQQLLYQRIPCGRERTGAIRIYLLEPAAHRAPGFIGCASIGQGVAGGGRLGAQAFHHTDFHEARGVEVTLHIEAVVIFSEAVRHPSLASTFTANLRCNCVAVAPCARSSTTLVIGSMRCEAAA